MPNGCLNPNAANYDSSATVDNFSCLYVLPDLSGNCQLFQDVLPSQIEDNSFTLSYSMLGNCWVFFHDYFPDMFIHTHQYLYALKDGQIYRTNDGPPGTYAGNTVPYSFFIDVVFTTEVRRTLGMVPSDYFKGGGDMLLESVQWVTEFYPNGGAESPFNTLTHLSIWNSKQHTGRIPLAQVFSEGQYKNMRRTQGSWSMNNFRDILQTNGSQFLLDIFDNYALDATQVPTSIPWYNKKPMSDQWFTVRFEFDNVGGSNLVLHDMIVQALKQDR